ncbi:hypothetical protein [Sphingomonas aerolata]|uniref:hypothetical protein n=1 Tax=Sphingomonas aerolata TaxID=185951 RepID=UPI00208EB593|nr:hypothetical protein [Sphingomonas aerolata]USR02385.1 hypothetical protein NEF64_18935 [Sphingomonas aerolata]
MILKRLVIPGNFVEAHLYFDFLWLIDSEGAIKALDLAEYIEARLNGDGGAAHKLFARNDRLVTSGNFTRASDQTPDVQRLLGSSEPIVMSSGDVDRFSYHHIAHHQLEEPLDVRFYNGRAFVGVPGALVQFRAPGRRDLSIEAARGSKGKQLNARRVFDEGTPIHLQCRFGIINIACGAEGGFYGLGALSSDTRWEVHPTKIVQTSFYAEVNAAGIGHVGSAARLHLSGTRMRNVDGPISNDDQSERREVASVDDEDMEAMARADRITHGKSDDVRAERMYLTTKQALVIMSDDSLRLFAYAKDAEFLHTDARVIELPSPASRILSTTTTCGKIVTECDDEICVLDKWKWHRIFDEPVYSTRGYPSSKWYRQLLTIVAEDRTELVFICEE